MSFIKGLLATLSLQWATEDYVVSLTTSKFGSFWQQYWIPWTSTQRWWIYWTNMFYLENRSVHSLCRAASESQCCYFSPGVCVCVGGHTCEVVGGSRRWGKGWRSIFMSGFLRFYFIFLISFSWSTYAFWCLRPRDFAFISDSEQNLIIRN